MGSTRGAGAPALIGPVPASPLNNVVLPMLKGAGAAARPAPRPDPRVLKLTAGVSVETHLSPIRVYLEGSTVAAPDPRVPSRTRSRSSVP